MAWERVSTPFDPDRCDGIDMSGQCWYKVVPGTRKCERHAYNKETESTKRKTLCNYRLQRWNDRVTELTHSEGLKSLREEIGISRMILEEVLNKCEDSASLIVYSDKIHHCTNQIQNLIVACQRLEERNGLLLDKAAVVSLADQMIKIVADHIDDTDKLAEIGNLFYESIMKTGSVTQQAHETLKNL